MAGKSKGKICPQIAREVELNDEIYNNLTSEEKKRRRRFSNEEIDAVFILADGHCEKCGEPLGSDWEIDHVKPYSLGGETTIQNAAALCKSCNRRKGNRYEG